MADPDPQEVVALRTRLAEIFAAMFARAGYVELAKLGVRDPLAVFNVPQPEIQQRALTLADKTLGQIAKTAGTRVRNVISDELGKGKDQFQIADALREQFRGVNTKQARTVMRTVTRDLYNGASLDAYASAGITHVFAMDGFGGLTGQTDPDCVARNGKRYTIAEAREQEHSPVTHPNCTLAWRPDVSTFPDDGPLPDIALGFDPAEPRDFHGRWRDEFGLPSPDVPIPSLSSLKPVFDLKERDKPLAQRAEFQSQKMAEGYFDHALRTAAVAAQRSERAAAKADVARHLHARLVNDPRWTPLSIHALGGREAVASLVDAWATTAGDHDTISMAIQVAAARELLGTDPRPSRLGGNDHGASPADMEVLDAKVSAYLKETGVEGSLRAFARAQYEATQIWLKQRGIERVQLVRGLSFKDNLFDDEHGQAEISMNPLSSWSLDPDTAISFAYSTADTGEWASLLLAEVPAERIFSIPRTGAGCLSEWEVIVLGAKSEPDVVLQYTAPYNNFLRSMDSILRLWGLA